MTSLNAIRARFTTVETREMFSLGENDQELVDDKPITTVRFDIDAACARLAELEEDAKRLRLVVDAAVALTSYVENYGPVHGCARVEIGTDDTTQ